MVVGGIAPFSSADNDVELIDLTGQGRTCQKPNDFPGAEEGAEGAYFDERVLVCGGHSYVNTSSVYYSECYYYNANGSWTQGPSMTEARGYAASSFFNNQWWMTGGDNNDVSGLASTELLDSDSNNFMPFLELPMERHDHNIISIDDNRVMLLGGQDVYQDTYLFDGAAWITGPLLSVGRYGSQAGLVTFRNGTQMIVAAGGLGEQTTEFLLVYGDEWHFGPDLPHEIRFGASVQLGNTFLIVGGYDGSIFYDTIWTFDVEAEDWIELNQHLTTARDVTAAFLVPDEYC